MTWRTKWTRPSGALAGPTPTPTSWPPSCTTSPKKSSCRLCAAIVDRLTFNGTIIETGTESYRLTQTKAKQQRG